MWLDKKEDEQDVNKAAPTNSPSIGAGGGVGDTNPTQGSSVSGNFSTVSPVAAPQAEQKWATAQDYLNANKPQANELGQKFETKLTDTLGSEKSAIDTAATNTQNAITAGTTAFNPDLVNEAVTSPTKITGDSQKLQDFMQQWNAAYTGPTEMTGDDSAAATKAVEDAKQMAGQLGTAGGRQNLFQEQFGVRGAGNQALDNTLVQSAENYGNIQNLAPQFTSLTDYLASKNTDVSNAASKAGADTAAAKTQTQKAFEGNVGKFQAAINASTKAAQEMSKTQYAKYSKDIAAGDFSAVVKDLRESGVDEAAATEMATALEILHGGSSGSAYPGFNQAVDPAQAYTFNPDVEINTANVATPEDYAKAAAYQQLTGVDYSGILNPADAAKAGTAPSAKSELLKDSPTLGTYLQGKLAQQQDELLNNTTAVDIPKFLAKFNLQDNINALESGNDRINSTNAGKTLQETIQRLLGSKNMADVNKANAAIKALPALAAEIYKQGGMATPGGSTSSHSYTKLQGLYDVLNQMIAQFKQAGKL